MTQKDAEEKSVWSLSFWQALSFWTMLIAAIAGVIAATAALVSRHAGSKASEIVQRESNERIAVAEQKAREADERIAIAGQKAAEANERASEADKKAAEANEKAEKERLARLRIEEKLAPRSLSQIKELVNKLKPFVGVSVAIRVLVDNNPDAIPLSEQIASVSQAAGWKTNIVHVALGEYVRGVVITPSDGPDTKASVAAKVLTEGLNADGITASLGAPPPPSNNQPNTMWMTIGVKL
jgi:hypothetical protein